MWLITDQIKSKQCHFDEHRFSASLMWMSMLAWQGLLDYRHYLCQGSAQIGSSKHRAHLSLQRKVWRKSTQSCHGTFLTDSTTDEDHTITVIDPNTNDKLVIPLTIRGVSSTFPTRNQHKRNIIRANNLSSLTKVLNMNRVTTGKIEWKRKRFLISIEVPKMFDDCVWIDQENGNTLWQDTIQQEMAIRTNGSTSAF